MSKITQLTPEQEALIPIYREKWCKIALSTERIDKKKAVEYIQAVYDFLGYSEPEILFFESIQSVCQNFISLLEQRISNLWFPTEEPFLKKIGNKLGKMLYHDCYDQIFRPLQLLNPQTIEWEYYYLPPFHQDGQCLYDIHNAICSSRLRAKLIVDSQLLRYDKRIKSIFKIKRKLVNKIYDNYYLGFIDTANAWILDYFNDVIKKEYNPQIFKLYKSIHENYSGIIPFRSICLVLNRPRKILLDNQNRLHAEGEAAIKYADGFKIYAHHGLALPEKYGKILPSEWKNEWLLTENDHRLKKILIQELDNREH